MNENFVIATTKLKNHHAAKFMDMGFQLLWGDPVVSMVINVPVYAYFY